MRQDKTAQQRLYILNQLDRLIGEEATIARFAQLSGLDKRAFLTRYNITSVFVHKIITKRAAYKKFVADKHLGLHGLRPFGPRGSTPGK